MLQSSCDVLPAEFANTPYVENKRQQSNYGEAMKNIVVIVLFLALSGCASRFGDSVVTSSGPSPSQQQAEEAAIFYIKAFLKDPDSMKQFEIFRGPTVVTWYRGYIKGGGYDQGWLVCFRYNAKNSYGAYAGLSADGIVLREWTRGEFVLVHDVIWSRADIRC